FRPSRRRPCSAPWSRRRSTPEQCRPARAQMSGRTHVAAPSRSRLPSAKEDAWIDVRRALLVTTQMLFQFGDGRRMVHKREPALGGVLARQLVSTSGRNGGGGGIA